MSTKRTTKPTAQANGTGPESVATHQASPTTTSWTTGLARFAGLAMALVGVLYIVTGTGALLQSSEAVPGLVHVFSIDAVTWGWIHIVAGALVGLAGMAVIMGTLWGRVIGIALTAVAIGVSFLSLSHHPALSILAIMLGFAVVWALCVFDEEASAASPTMLD
jgi:hypothetical protein